MIAVIALLIGLMLPALSGTREEGRKIVCLSNLRQLGSGWVLYAVDFRDRAMPLAYWDPADIGTGQQVFWWGTHGSATVAVDHEQGFVAPYIEAPLGKRSVFECPSQPWGSYRAQGQSREPTSTYGYNGYYLSPSKTPGWALTIGHRPWRRLYEIMHPAELLVFADTLLPATPVRNNALLDPPRLFEPQGVWRENTSPTTAFRHSKRAGIGMVCAMFSDASAHAIRGERAWLTHPALGIGSISESNSPRYVPDADEW